MVQANQIINGVRKFLDVLAVQRLNRPLEDQIMTVIEAEDTAGVAGLYYIRSSAGSGKVFASAKIPAQSTSPTCASLSFTCGGTI